MKKKTAALLLIAFFLQMFVVPVSYADEPASYISKVQYYDKTLAMILGQCAGVTTGYEYCHVINGDGSIDKTSPWIAMPDDAFLWMNGTLGGGTYTREYSWATRIPCNGVILNDDDLTIDFFTQHILDAHGPTVTYEDFKYEWLDHDVRDFGGGDYAKRLMGNLNISANNAGKYEHGNACYWLTESYIGYESLGCNFPGKPASAVDFAQMPIGMVSDTDSTTWGKWWVAMYADAYFETDVRDALENAAYVFPAGSHPKALYDKCVELYENDSTDWRAAVREIVNYQYPIYLVSMMNAKDRDPSINNAFAILAILYGNNDYTQTLKIASLAGYDGDCTAAGIGGLMGIIKGMSGTPQIVKDRIYVNGNGVYRNEQYMARIGRNYPIEQKFTDLASLYQSNTERMLEYLGATVTSSGYYITQEQIPNSTNLTIPNYDFEKGTLENWSTWSSSGSATFFAESQQETPGSYTASTGYYKGTAITANDTDQAKMWVTVTGLEPNRTYQIDAEIRGPFEREIRLYADNYGGEYLYSSAVTGCGGYWPVMYANGETDCWAHRSIVITTGNTNTSAEIGLHLPPSAADSKWGNIDNISIKAIVPQTGDVLQAESATIESAAIISKADASNGQYVGMQNTPSSSISFLYLNQTAGEKRIRIHYANGGTYVLQKLVINNNPCSNIILPATGSSDGFSQNVSEIYAPMASGSNVITISTLKGAASIDYIEIIHNKTINTVSYYPFDFQQIINGGIYQIASLESGHVLSVSGNLLSNGTNVSTATNQSLISQKWQLIPCGDDQYFVRSVGSTKMLDVTGGSYEDGANINQWEQNNYDCQKWEIQYVGDGSFSIKAIHSNKYLTEETNGNVIQNYYTGADNQKWTMTFLPAEHPLVNGATYMLRSAKNGLYIDIDGNSVLNGANVVQMQKSSSSSQKWIANIVGHWQYSFTSASSGKKMEVKAELTNKGAGIGIWDSTGNPNQKWLLSYEYLGCYKIIAANSSKVIDIPGGSNSNGLALWQWDYFDYGGEHQNWYFEVVALP